MKKIEPFFFGIIAAVGALILESVISIIGNFQGEQVTYDFFSFKNFFIYLFVFIVIEETFKYLIIIKKIKLFSEKKEFISNCLILGFGFAIFELFLILSKGGEIYLSFIYIPSILAIILMHISTSGIMGYLILKFTKIKKRFPIPLIIAFLIHFSYNTMAIQTGKFQNYFTLLFVLLFVLIIFISWNGEQKKLAN